PAAAAGAAAGNTQHRERPFGHTDGTADDGTDFSLRRRRARRHTHDDLLSKAAAMDAGPGRVDQEFALVVADRRFVLDHLDGNGRGVAWKRHRVTTALGLAAAIAAHMRHQRQEALAGCSLAAEMDRDDRRGAT